MSIKDIDIYKQRMNTTIIEKLFWTKHIFEPISQLIDVGCADGTLLNVFNLISPETELIGVDNNEQMLASVPENIKTYQTLDDIPSLKPGSVLNLSSVLHEIYSYEDEKDINKFWDNVSRLEPEYITIRDMYCDESLDGYTCLDGYSNGVTTLKNKILQSEYAQQLKDFENVWGPVTDVRSLIHFLLKYEYKENWDRELRENYLSWNIRDITKKLKDKYTIVSCCQVQLPYFTYKLKRDFKKSSFPYNTHIQIVLKKKA